MTKRSVTTLLALSVISASALVAPGMVMPAAAQVDFSVTVGTPPPPPRYEPVPPPRAGYVWAPGYWRWEHDHHVWETGRWMARREDYRWVADHWVRHEGGYSHMPGHWEH